MTSLKKVLFVAAAVGTFAAFGVGTASASVEPVEYTPVSITCADSYTGNMIAGLGAGAVAGTRLGGPWGGLGGAIVGGAGVTGMDCHNVIEGHAIPEREAHKK